LGELPFNEQLRAFAENVSVKFSSRDDLFGYYPEESDRPMSDALACLPLPSWASTSHEDSGGPGSGYTAAYLLIQEPHTIEEYAAWLEVRALAAPASPATATRSAKRQGPPAPRKTRGSRKVIESKGRRPKKQAPKKRPARTKATPKKKR
jgi:hypothetical protein